MGVHIQQRVVSSHNTPSITGGGGDRFKKVSSPNSSARANPDSATKSHLSPDSSPRTNLGEGQDEKLGPVVAKLLLLRNNGYRRLRPSMEKIDKMRNERTTHRRYLPVHILSTGSLSTPSARLALSDADYEASRSVIIFGAIARLPDIRFLLL